MTGFGLFLIILTAVIVMYFVFQIWKVRKRSKTTFASLMVYLMLGIGLTILYELGVLTAYEVIYLFAIISLVLVTAIYAVKTEEIAKATERQASEIKKQADASLKMADEIREQRLMASRPIIIQRPAYHMKQPSPGAQMIREYFSVFEIYNVGNGPAIELEVAVVDKEKDWKDAVRETFFGVSEDRIIFEPSNLERLTDSNIYYLVSEYQGIFSRIGEQTWYQTWLPFKVAKASKEGKFIVTAGELEFKEVTEEERINAFREKPK